MRSIPNHLRSRLGVAAFCFATLAFAGNCTLGPLQALLFHFTIDDAIAAGASEEVYKAHYPLGVTLKKYFVRVSGHLDTQGAAVPKRVTVIITGEDQETGKRNQKITLKLTVKDDGAFTATKKIKKNIPAGTVQTFTANPSGEDLPAGTEVWACIDIAKKKGDLAPASDCHGDNTGGTPAPDVRIVEVLDDSFEPKSLTIQAGDTVRWVLRGSRSNHTTTEMNSTWSSGFVFSADGDFFEHTFPANTDGQTFLYSCVSHKDCCEMQGSIRVGLSAPAPDDGY